MPRPNSPWFRKQTGWWYVKIAGKQYKLAKGKGNKKQAVKRFHQLMASFADVPESSNVRAVDV